MLENTETNLVEEEATEENTNLEKDNSKITFPVAGIVVIAVLAVCIAICLIVIFALGGN